MDKIGKESHKDKASVDLSGNYAKKYVSNKIHHSNQNPASLNYYSKGYQIIYKRAH